MPARLKSPHLLKEGQTVGLIAPSSPVFNKEEIPGGIRALEELGLKVKVYPSVHEQADYLAGPDKRRASDLRNAFLDPKIAAVVCIRGGYGASRLLGMIDWREIGRTRKPLLGFSDITSLHGALQSRAGLVSFHGANAGWLAKRDKATAIMQDNLRQFLFHGWSGFSFREACGKAFNPQPFRKGRARGRIFGGNLSLFAGLVGTPYLPKHREVVLFIEEIGEKVYKLDRFLTQIMLAGYFDNVTGIVIGDIRNCEPGRGDADDALTVLERCLRPLRKPILAGLPVGHCRPTWTIPLGAEVELDATGGDLRLL